MAENAPLSESQRRPSSKAQDLERHAAESSTGILREFWDFLKYNKKWWLLPIVIVLLLVAVLIILGGSAAAPFIYTLF